MLIDSGINVNLPDNYNYTALSEATNEGDAISRLWVFLFILQFNCPLRSSANSKTTHRTWGWSQYQKQFFMQCVAYCCRSRWVSFVLWSILIWMELVSFLLIILAHSGRKGVAKYLIENGADLNAKNSIGSTPLQWAASDGCRISRNSPVSYVDNTEILKMLIANGADIDIKNHFGATALNWAVRNSEHQIFCILINNTGDQKFHLIFFLNGHWPMVNLKI